MWSAVRSRVLPHWEPYGVVTDDQSIRDRPGGWLFHYSTLVDEIPTRPDAVLGPIQLFKRIDNAEPFARVETRFHATYKARTRCRPRGALPAVLVAAFWAYWN